MARAKEKSDDPLFFLYILLNLQMEKSEYDKVVEKDVAKKPVQNFRLESFRSFMVRIFPPTIYNVSLSICFPSRQIRSRL